MRTLISPAFLLALVVLFHSPAVAAEPADGVALFDGKTFAGWEGNLKSFRIEDGAIVGGAPQRANPPQRVPLHREAIRRLRAAT